MEKRISVSVHNHQNKASGLIAEIRRDERFEYVDFLSYADILLIDHDATEYYKRAIMTYKRSGAKVLLYPHGATAHLAWDGVWEPFDMVDGFIAMSYGQAETMWRYGYPKPVYVTGWHWCEKKPFTPAQGKEVLFAPIHALSNGFIHPDIKALNGLIHDQLCRMNIGLTVRYIGSLEDCGIESTHNDVIYTQGRPDNSIDDIDSADYVVSFGTFAYLAIARGKPTIMYRQDLPYFDGHSIENIKEAENWELYGDFMRYPIDMPHEGDILAQANADSLELSEWKDLFIGDQMAPGTLGDILLEVMNV